jgi:hypothetical protein
LLVSKDSNLCPFSGLLTPESIIRQQISIIYTSHQSLCGTAWFIASPSWQKNMACITFRAPSHFLAALLHINVIPFYTLTPVLDQMRTSTTRLLSKSERNPSPSLLHQRKCTDANSTGVAHQFQCSMNQINSPHAYYTPS